MSDLRVVLARMIPVLEDYVKAQLALKSAYTEDRYSKEIYDAASAYWKDGRRGSFSTRMNATIKFGLTSAFEQGADKVGVAPDEFEQPDKDYRDSLIDEEKSHVSGLLDFLDGLANDPNAKLSDANYRLDMWVKRYSDVYEKALLNFGQKVRFIWRYGDTIAHCASCSGLEGLVAWGSEWEQAGIKPKSSLLACGGYQCDCSIDPTDKRRSPKALQRIMDVVEATHS
jgi:hypothetical protein